MPRHCRTTCSFTSRVAAGTPKRLNDCNANPPGRTGAILGAGPSAALWGIATRRVCLVCFARVHHTALPPRPPLLLGLADVGMLNILVCCWTKTISEIVSHFQQHSLLFSAYCSFFDPLRGKDLPVNSAFTGSQLTPRTGQISGLR